MIVSKAFLTLSKQFQVFCLFFLFLPLFFVSVSFFGEDEEKQLRQLHQNAEIAMQAERYVEAKKSYADLLERIDVHPSQKYKIDWPSYLDMVERFAIACEALNEKEDGEKLAQKLLAEGPPPELLPRAKLLKARLTTGENALARAYVEMKEVFSSSPKEQWKRQDLLLFHAIEHSLNSGYDDLVKKAKRYLTAEFYEEALSFYQEILEAIEKGFYPKAALPESLISKKIRYRLAESHFNLEHDDTSEKISLAAACYKNKKDYEKALQLFQNYPKKERRPDLDHYAQALLEKGLFFFQNDNLAIARDYFERLVALKKGGRAKVVATLFLAKIHLKENCPDEVEKLLLQLPQELAAKSPLRYESFYLRGEAAYQLGNYVAAEKFFEKALPRNLRVRWKDQTLCRLGWCSIKLGEDLSKAEKIFQSLLSSSERESAALSLAKLDLLRSDPEHLFSLLKEHSEEFSLPGKHEALLLQAEGAESYQEKEKWLEMATAPYFQSVISYADAWCERGLNYFQKGMRNQAATAFEKAFSIAEKKGVPLLKLEKLLSQLNEMTEECEESLYLRGLLFSQKKNLHRLLIDYPESPLAGEALFLIARSEEKLGNDSARYYELVYKDYPECSKAPEAFFRRYPYKSYLEGDRAAINHLKNFADHFSTSPFSIVASYLIGINAECSKTAKDAFKEGLQAFSACLETGKIDNGSVYFRYQMLLELSLCYMREGKYEKSEQFLSSIIKDFSEDNHPLTALLKEKTSYPPLFEESEYYLALCFLHLDREVEAQKLFCRMLAHYEEADIRESYYLSEVWREQGKLAIRCNDFATALSCLDIADECGPKQQDGNQAEG